MKSCRPDCQCPNCDPEMASIMSMSSEQYAGWLRLNSEKARSLSAQTPRRATLRTTSVPHDYAAPDPYTNDIAALRAADAHADSISLRSYPCTKTELQYDANGVPEPYAAGIARMQKEAQ